jgi:formylglycine-generating enzyme
MNHILPTLLTILCVCCAACSKKSDMEHDESDDSATEVDTEVEIVENCTDGWCVIPAATYLFGSSPDKPCRSASAETQVIVTLTHPFEILSTEVTQKMWTDLEFENPVPDEFLCPNCPVESVSWFETIAWCNALSEKKGLDTCYDLSCCIGTPGIRTCENSLCEEDYHCDCDVYKYENVYECPGYRLPTVAEWEWAARAGTTDDTYNGQPDLTEFDNCDPNPIINEISWNCSNADAPMEVAQLKKNGFGLYDMIGNVKEFCSDPYQNVALGGDSEYITDPHGYVESSSGRVAKGSGFSSHTCTQTTSRTGSAPVEGRAASIGFRPVLTLLNKTQ